MANPKHDPDDVDPANERPGGAPRPSPQDAERSSLPEGFLPDDSFLLDVDDESARAPAPLADAAGLPAQASGGEEWIVVDDDLNAGASETAAAPPPASVEPPRVEVHAEEPAEPVVPRAAPQTAVPKWLTGTEEGELPSFASQDAEVASAAAPVAAAAPLPPPAVEVPVEEPVEAAAPVAPVVPLRRTRRKQLVAAAGILVVLGLGAAFYFWNSSDGGGTEVAIAPRPRPVVKQPDPKPEPEPVVVAPEPEPAPAEPIAPQPVEPEPAPVELERSTPKPAPTERPVVIDTLPKRPLPPTLDRKSTGAPPPKGDTIVELKNGHTFRGQITRVKGTRVTLRVGAGECVFELADVTLLDSSAPEYRRIDQMPEASIILTSGQHLRGRLMKQTEKSIVLVVNNGQVVFPRSDIRDVSFTGRIHF